MIRQPKFATRPTSRRGVKLYSANANSVLSLLLALLVAGSLASCGKMGKPDDAAITTDIKAKMFSEPRLKAATVDVSIHGGEVTLTGQVPDDSARLAAYKIASEAKGVTKVNDQMTVLTATAAATPPGDASSASSPAAETKPAEPATAAKTPSRKTARPKPAAEAQGASGGAGAVTSTDSAATARTAQPATAAAPAAPPPPQPRTVTVPSGAIITVRTIDSIDSSVNTTGQVFKASLDAPIVVDDRVIVPKGADAYMKLENAKSAGKFAGKSELALALQSVVFQGLHAGAAV